MSVSISSTVSTPSVSSRLANASFVGANTVYVVEGSESAGTRSAATTASTREDRVGIPDAS